MPDNERWLLIAGILAAIGGYLRFYMLNRNRKMTLIWWRDAVTDVAVSALVGIIVFLIASPVIGDTSAAGLGGFAGHIGARSSALLIRRYLDKKK